MVEDSVRKEDDNARFVQELEHLGKAHKSGLLSAKEYRGAKKVLEKQRSMQEKKIKTAQAKEKAMEEILGQQLQPTKVGFSAAVSMPGSLATSTSNEFIHDEKAKGKKKQVQTRRARDQTDRLKKAEIDDDLFSTDKGSRKYFLRIQKPKKPEISNKQETIKKKFVKYADKSIDNGADNQTETSEKEVKKQEHVVQQSLHIPDDAKYKDIDTIVEDHETNWRLGLAVLTIFLLILLYIKFTSFGTVGNVIAVDAYLDYASGYSYETYFVMQKIKENYGDVVWITYHFIGANEQSRLTHTAVACAEDQEMGQLYLSFLFDKEINSWSTVEDLVSFATEVGLDSSLFSLCLDGDVKEGIYSREVAAAQELGIEYTPTLVINNKKIVGDVGYDTIHTIIEKELANLG